MIIDIWITRLWPDVSGADIFIAKGFALFILAVMSLMFVWFLIDRRAKR